MVQTVKIRKGEKVFRVSFMYNTDLIDIMREHQGWWYRKEKSWQFPHWKFDEVYDHLTDAHYNVTMGKLEIKKKESKGPKQISIDYWKEPDVVSVAGHCKECGQWHFLNKEKLCTRCSLRMRRNKNG